MRRVITVLRASPLKSSGKERRKLKDLAIMLNTMICSSALFATFAVQTTFAAPVDDFVTT